MERCLFVVLLNQHPKIALLLIPGKVYPLEQGSPTSTLQTGTIWAVRNQVAQQGVSLNAMHLSHPDVIPPT